MSYLQKNRPATGNPRSILLRLAIFLVIFFGGVFVIKIVATSAYEYLQPVRYVVDRGVLYVKSTFSSKYGLETQIETLKAERDVLRAKVNELRLYEHFAKDVVGSTSTGKMFARVTSRPPFTMYDVLLLNKGTKDGIEIGMKVYTASTSLPIGLISEVSAASSYVTLFSNSDQKSEIEIGSSTTSYEAFGSGNGVFETRVPRSVSVLVGDIVRMPSKTLFPYSTVEDVESDDTDPFSTIRFRLPIGFNQLEFVQIDS